MYNRLQSTISPGANSYPIVNGINDSLLKFSLSVTKLIFDFALVLVGSSRRRYLLLISATHIHKHRIDLQLNVNIFDQRFVIHDQYYICNRFCFID